MAAHLEWHMVKSAILLAAGQAEAVTAETEVTRVITWQKIQSQKKHLAA
jgi:hypothetical protein